MEYRSLRNYPEFNKDSQWDRKYRISDVKNKKNRRNSQRENDWNISAIDKTSPQIQKQPI